MCPFHWQLPILNKTDQIWLFIVGSIRDARNKTGRNAKLYIAVMFCLHRITFTNHNHHIPHCLCVQLGSLTKNPWSPPHRYLVPIHTLAIHHQEMHRQACCRDQAWFRPQGVHSCTAMGFYPNTEVLFLVGSMQEEWRVCCGADLTPVVACEASAHIYVLCQCCSPSKWTSVSGTLV